MGRAVGLAMLLMTTLLASGCGSGSATDAEIEALLRDVSARGHDGGISNPAILVHDFGPVLAQAQELRHDFTLTNPTQRPMRLVSAEAFTPCCSAVGPLPDEPIPPGGEGTVSILFQPGHHSGRKRVEFAVRTDVSEHPAFRLAVRTSLTSEWEVADLSASGRSLPVGQPGERRLRVTRRAVLVGEGQGGGDEPATVVPEVVEAAAPLHARFLGEPLIRTLPDGLVESTREVLITLPASSEVGSQRGEVVFRWADGRSRPHVIAWEVTPLLRASPSGLVLRPTPSDSSEPVEQTVVVTGDDDRPFRVTAVSGALLAEPIKPPTDAGRTHRLHLRLDPSRASEASASDLRIATDHPDQPEVTVSVLVLPTSDAKGAGE